MYYTVFVIELHSRRVHVLGSTPHPDEAFVVQTMRHLTDGVDGVLCRDRLLICDRDRKWSAAVEGLLASAGVHVIRTPFQAPNCNAHAERFVRSIREECLNRVIPLGEDHLRRTLADFLAHYHGERNHQGLGNELIERASRPRTDGPFAGASVSVDFSVTTTVPLHSGQAEFSDITGSQAGHVTLSAPHRLFFLGPVGGTGGYGYDVGPRSERFLALTFVERPPEPISVILNRPPGGH